MNIHVIKSRKKFAVKLEGNKIATRLFDHSEQAFYFAKNTQVKILLAVMKVKDKLEEIKIIVHNNDGSVKFIEVINYEKTTNTSI